VERRELGLGYSFEGWVNTGGTVSTSPNIALRDYGPDSIFYGKVNPGGLDYRLYAFENPTHLDLGLNVLKP
jgi:hypothetical protein